MEAANFFSLNSETSIQTTVLTFLVYTSCTSFTERNDLIIFDTGAF